MFRYGITNFNLPVEKSIRIILVYCYVSLPKIEKKKVIDAVIKSSVFLSFKLATNVVLSGYASGKITEKVVSSAIIKKLLRYMVGAELTLLSLQGLLYKAGEASDRLNNKSSRIYWDLRTKILI